MVNQRKYADLDSLLSISQVCIAFYGRPVFINIERNMWHFIFLVFIFIKYERRIVYIY